MLFFIVVGDIHGQYYDFVKLLEVGGDPDTTQYVYLYGELYQGVFVGISFLETMLTGGPFLLRFYFCFFL